MKWILIYLVVFMGISSCGLSEKDHDIQKRENAVNLKEQELMEKEKSLQMKEQELRVREQQMDSTMRQDTAAHQDSALVGSWQVKMTCTETTCTGSAVGDTKTEQWMISYEANHIVAKAIDGGNVSRIYTGFFSGNTIELVDSRPGTRDHPAIKMIVRFRIVDGTITDGQREIFRENGCKVTYALQMEKQ